jgi:hypothetical protein
VGIINSIPDQAFSNNLYYIPTFALFRAETPGCYAPLSTYDGLERKGGAAGILM